jgi:SAM-dependent methyltransferase
MLPPENVFGHRRRLDWIREQLHPSDEVLDFGCGTGALITIPLLALGHRVTGIDIHHDSVAYGQALLERAGLDRHALKATDLVQLEGSFDVAIAAEVLEHLDDEELAWVLRLLHAKLKAGGRLLLTVPNGFGLFELESSAYELLRKHGPLKRIAVRRAGRREGDPKGDPMSLGQTPHQQRFTWRRLKRVLGRAGFDVEGFDAATLTCGPLSARVLPRSDGLMAANAWLGRRFPRIAADYYIRARRRD